MNKLYYEEDLPLKIKEGNIVIDWVNSIGKTVRFKFNGMQDKLTIVDYSSKNNKVVIKYKDLLYSTYTHRLKKCQLTSMFSNIFLYKKGDIINNMMITDCFFKYKNNCKQKFYRYVCLKCKWDRGEINESSLKNGGGCSCCRGFIVVPGINDICTTHPWMIPYFQGGKDEASKYTHGSYKKIYPICPDCGRIKSKPMSICQIKCNGGIGCNCSKSNSYPNKFIFKMLDQLQIKFESEKVFEWAKFARYDFCFISPINNKKYIIEADGAYGHGNHGDDFEKIESLYFDYRKDSIAKKYNIDVIRIDCKESSLNYIKEQVLKSELSQLLDLTNIDWNLCNEYATKNLVKEICMLYKEGKSVKEIHELYNYISKDTIRNYLHRGTELKWCEYNGKQNRLKAGKNNGYKNAKEIIVFNGNMQYICTWSGIMDFVKNSNKIIGIKTNNISISNACKTGKIYKGFYYKFKSDVTESEYSKLSHNKN